MFKSQIKTELNKILEELNVHDDKITVEKPTDEKYGDYATNAAMMSARILKKSPIEISKDIVRSFPKLDFLEKIEIEHPGFINFYIKKGFFVQNLDQIVQSGDLYGSSDTGKGSKVVIEHTNVNPNKALHIGHLRSACLGSASENLLKFLGYDTEVQYYVDDTGVQVAVTALGMKKINLKQNENEKFDHFASRVYVETMKKIEVSSKLEEEKKLIINNLDSQQGEYVQFVKELTEKIIQSNLVTVDKFGIEYDLLVWESDILASGFWEKAFEILKENPSFKLVNKGKNKGCWVMEDIMGEEKIIVKSNGVVTYTGKDIAYHMWKFNLLSEDFKYKKWQDAQQKKPLWTTAKDGSKSQKYGKANLVVNFVDTRQSFPQQAVKESLARLGFEKESKNLHHVAYGVVSLSPKTARDLGADTSSEKNQYAMSGRKGLTVFVDNLLNLVKKQVKMKHPKSPEIDRIATSAIKYYMLSHNTFSDIVFSYDRALDIYGNSGPYLQYTFARANSVLRNAAKEKMNVEYKHEYEELELAPSEKALLRWIHNFPETVSEAGKQYSPNLLCNFLFELAKRFNTFYTKHPILKSKKGPVSRDFRLLLTAATAQVIKNGLNLLGIDAVEKM